MVMTTISIEQLAAIFGGQQAEAPLPLNSGASNAVRNATSRLGEDLAGCAAVVKSFDESYRLAPFDYNTGAINNNPACKALAEDVRSLKALPQIQPGR
jgi:hypothetical protein